VEKYLSLSFPYMAICWLLAGFRIVEGGGGNWPRFPIEFRGHALRLCFWILVGEDPLFGWPTGVEDCSFESSWGQTDAWGMYEQKAVLAW
jgi:hypothetical protein